MTRFAGVIVAAGASRRMATETKKEYLPLKGRPLLVWAVEPFLDCAGLQRLIVVVPAADRERARRLLASCLPLDRIRIVAGGARRQDSVRRGLDDLRELAPEIVLVHDGARPFVRRELIERVAAAARRYGACIPVQPALEAAKLVGASGLVVGDLPRPRVKLAQTPQGFRFAPLLDAYARADSGPGEREYFDDAEVYGTFVGPVHTVQGDPDNRKITYPRDLSEDS